MAEKYVFGIDLGTTYSCISYVDETGRPVVINIDGQSTTPSVVQILDDGNVVVGQIAKDSAVAESDSVVDFVKRRMGKEGANYSIGGNDYTPEQISAFILKKMVEDIRDSSLGLEVKDVVITCPADFGEAERLATKNAGIIADLNVMEIIKEPLAAAIHFGCRNDDVSKTYLVYDLGGGTFDVTIMQIGDGKIEEVCSDGNPKLGGKDWDDIIINYLREEFASLTGLSTDSFGIEEEQMLRSEVEKAKIRLSAKNEAPIRATISGQSERIVLTREIFDDLTSSKLDQTFDLVDSAIESAKAKGVDKIDEILLVGGSTKMPQVKQAIIERYGIEPKIHEPDEAVAKGAALWAAMVFIEKRKEYIEWIEGGGNESDKPQVDNLESYSEDLEVDSFLIGGESELPAVTTASTKSYGIRAYKPGSNDPFVSNILLKNMQLSNGIVKGSEEYGTREDNQPSMLIEVFESDFEEKEYDIEEGTSIGNAELSLPPGLPAGAQARVTLSLNNEGLLHVYAKDLTNNCEVEANLHVIGSLSQDQVKELTEKTKGVQISEY